MALRLTMESYLKIVKPLRFLQSEGGMVYHLFKFSHCWMSRMEFIAPTRIIWNGLEVYVDFSDFS